MTQYYNLTKFLAAGMFRKDSPIIPDGALPPQSEAGIVLTRVRQLVEERRINEAENLVFDSFDKKKPVFAAIAIELYARLSELSEEELEAADFSVEEIGEGIRDMMNFYNVKIAMKDGKPVGIAPDPEAVKAAAAARAEAIKKIPAPERLRGLTKFLAAAMFRKESPIIPAGALAEGSEEAELLMRVRLLTDDGKLLEAEQAVVGAYNTDKPIYAAIALEFYTRVCDFSESELAAADYSIAKAEEGVRGMMNFYKVRIALKNDQAPDAAKNAQPKAPAADPNADQKTAFNVVADHKKEETK